MGMRKSVIALLALLLTLSGCRMGTDIRLDTIVDIPLHPTEPTQPETEIQTEPVTETEPFVIPNFNPGLENSTVPDNSPDGETQPPATERQTEGPAAPTVDVGAIYDISDYVPGTLEYEILAAINARRDSAVGLNGTLCGIASVRAYEASVNRSNIRPDGREGLSVLGDYGWNAAGAGEILYYTANPNDAGHMVDIWMKSDRSRDALLDAACATAGVGLYRDPNGLTYIAVILVK